LPSSTIGLVAGIATASTAATTARRSSFAESVGVVSAIPAKNTPYFKYFMAYE